MRYSMPISTPMQGEEVHGWLVVVADDDAFQRSYASAILRKLGFIPIEAADGVEALALVRNTGAQLLICDLDMPASTATRSSGRSAPIGPRPMSTS